MKQVRTKQSYQNKVTLRIVRTWVYMSDVAEDVFADDWLSAARLHEGSELVKVWVQLIDAGVGLVEEGDFGLRRHDGTGQTFLSICSSVQMRRVRGSHLHPVLHTLRDPGKFPPHVDKEASSQPLSGVRLQVSRLGEVWQIHPVLYEVCKAVVPKDQRLAVASPGQ